MAGRTAVARVLSAVALFALAFMLSPHRVVAEGEAVIQSNGPLTQVFITADLACQVAYVGDPAFEFYPPDSTIGNCGTFVAVGGSVAGPAGGPATLVSYSPVSQTPVTGSGTVSDPFRVVTTVDILGSGLRIEEADNYAVGSRSYRTDVQITNTGNAAQTGTLYRAADCYLQGFDTGFVRVQDGSPACIVDPALGQRIEQWLPITVGSRYFAGQYSDVWSIVGSQSMFPNTCSCTEQFTFDNGAGLAWPFTIAPGISQTFSHETFFSPVGRGPVTQSLRNSVPDPTRITLDPIVVAQSVALTAGVIVLVPFPSALFNNTLEENYAEVMGWLARLRAWSGRVWRNLRRAIRSRTAGRKPATDVAVTQPSAGAAPAQARSFLVAAPPPAHQPGAEADATAGPAHPLTDPWQSPLRIAGFVLLTALLYAFLDPTFGFSLDSLATFGGLAIGLFVVLIAYGLPLLVRSRVDGFKLTVRALPATLIVGVLCVLVSRFANFQPGYLYGLIVGFFFAHGVERRLEGRAEAFAAAASLIVALVAWITLALLRGTAGQVGDLTAALLEAATVTVVVAGLENAVFAMLPLRFMPGAQVFAWNRRVWVVLMALGLFGFVHVLLNPAAGAGYLADTTRTSFFTLIGLLAIFGVASVLFWAYFRFRPHRPAAPPTQAAQ